MWARRAILYAKNKSTNDPTVNRLVQLAADKGDPEAQWWIDHKHLIVTMVLNKPGGYSEEDLTRAHYHYNLFSGGYPAEPLKVAATRGHLDAIYEYAGWPNILPMRLDDVEIIKRAAEMGSVEALQLLKADPSLHVESIKERALNGCPDAAVYLTEYETESGRDPDLCENSLKECTVDDALWRFLLLVSGPLHPMIVHNKNLDAETVQILTTINGSGARYQFGLCTHQMIDLIPERLVPTFMPFVLGYRRASEGAKEAVVTWTLVGHRAGICRDIRKMIGEMIWADRVDWMITKGEEEEEEESPGKRIKI
jgi:hypothetical protein